MKLAASLSVFAAFLLSSCGTKEPVAVEAVIQPAVTQSEIINIQAPSTQTGTIQDSISWATQNAEKKLVTSAPYEKYTLSKEESTDFSKVMGVQLPSSIEGFGELFLNVDWDSKWTVGKSTSIADAWRKINLWFSKLYSDETGGWWMGFVEYSTYDFQIGSEYETFATKNDFESLKKGEEKDVITANGTKGIVSYKFETSYETPSKIRKIVAFPFGNHYVAVVYTLLGDYSKWGDDAMKDLYAGKYPEAEKAGLKNVDDFVSSLKFEEKQ